MNRFWCCDRGHRHDLADVTRSVIWRHCLSCPPADSGPYRIDVEVPA